MQKILRLSAALLALSLYLPLCAQSGGADTASGSPSLFDFFYHHEDELPVLKLETDWKQLVREKLEEAYQPGVMAFHGPDGSLSELKVMLRARGNARKKVCYFPPLKVKATQGALKELGLESGGKLKLVLPCGNGKSDEECLLREALAYQLYQAVHPMHHRTRIVKLEGWHNGKAKYSFYAFLVEDEKDFAQRVGGKRIKEERIRTIDLERDAYVKMCFFQYMIGNTDWSEPNSHNLQVLELPGYDKLVPIPYDFDYSGFVDTDYAKPRSSLPIEDVEERYFLGKYVTEDEALECAQYYLSKKEQFLQLCLDFGWVDEKPMRSIRTFVTDFFSILEDEEQVLATFVTRPMRRR